MGAELFDPSFLAKIYAKFFKIQTFVKKKGPKMLCSAHFLQFSGSRHHKTAVTINKKHYLFFDILKSFVQKMIFLQPFKELSALLDAQHYLGPSSSRIRSLRYKFF